MAEIKLSFAHWPVVLTTAPPGTVSDAEMLSYLERFRAEIARRRAPFISVLDLRANSGITPAQRKMITEGMTADNANTAFCKAFGMVFSSSLLAGMLTAIFWVRKPKYETKVFTEVHDALDWGREQMLAVKVSSVA